MSTPLPHTYPVCPFCYKPGNLNEDGEHDTCQRSQPSARNRANLYRTDEPTMDELEEMADEGIALATDGCMVEPDGTCPHGADSWLIELGLI